MYRHASWASANALTMLKSMVHSLMVRYDDEIQNVVCTTVVHISSVLRIVSSHLMPTPKSTCLCDFAVDHKTAGTIIFSGNSSFDDQLNYEVSTTCSF